MKYLSTRDETKKLKTFEEVVMEGLSSDDGLYVPMYIPKITKENLESWKTLSYQDLAFEIMSIYIPSSEIPSNELKRIISKSYSSNTFSDLHITPLLRMNAEHYILEQFHGPTCAFKDVALQFLGNLFEYFLSIKNSAKNQSKKSFMTIIGATSGDTGSAAIYGLKGKENIKLFILHPKGRISLIQESQMTSILDKNVYNIAVSGTFDNCQDIIKKCFEDQEMKKELHLGAINSINWARILAQIVYYFYSYFRWNERNSDKLFMDCNKNKAIRFIVPSGNFGNALAGFYAKKMGLPIYKILVSTNENDILCRFLNSLDYSPQPVIQTLAPAMDIQKASNFERYLFYLLNNNVNKLKKCMNLINSGVKIDMSDFPNNIESIVKDDFCSFRVSDEEIKETINYYKQKYNYNICPHTAVGLFSYLKLDENEKKIQSICFATAHPAKFQNNLYSNTNIPSLPSQLVGLENAEKRLYVLENDVSSIKNFIKLNSLETNNHFFKKGFTSKV